MRSERLLVSMKHYIGDAVMTEPMLTAVEQTFARVEIHAGGLVPEVLWIPGTPRKFLTAAKPKKPWEIVEQARALRSRSYDVAILVNRSFRSAFTARLAGIKTRIGHNTEGRGALLTRAVGYDPSRFEVLSLLELSVEAGAKLPERMPTLNVTAEERTRGAELAQGAAVGIQPGARWPGKQLPVDISIDLTRRLIANGETVALLGGPEEAEAVGQVISAVGLGTVSLVGKSSLRESLGVLSCMKAMVGSDTGLMHLAAGVGCPTVTVFGPTSHTKWGHAYSPHRVLAAPDGDMSKVLACDVMNALQEVLESK